MLGGRDAVHGMTRVPDALAVIAAHWLQFEVRGSGLRSEGQGEGASV